MSDVLNRLRSIQNDCAQYVWHNAIMREAADEIERQQQRIRELESENTKLNKRYSILAMHMAEVKAIADGCHKNTLSDVVEHCLNELESG